VWALGCCVYYLSAKVDPFVGETSDIIIKNIKNLQIDEKINYQ